MATTRTFQSLLVILLVGMIASVTYALAAANAGPVSVAGDGANTVSGYTVTNITYTMNTADPSQLDAVSFTLDATAHTVKIKLSEFSSIWYVCSNIGGNDWDCNTIGATLASINQLRVTASNH